MKKVALIGAGNVATNLATELKKHSFEIKQIYSRTESSARFLATLLECEYTTNLSDIITDANIYIFSVKDSVLEEVISKISANKGIWLHTAGSMPMDIFNEYSEKYGVLYPLQTFTKGQELDWKNTPIFTEGNNSEILEEVTRIANILSDKVYPLSSKDRRLVHLTGVFASNFTNHMYALSEQILSQAGLPFDVALPIIDETCQKAHKMSPLNAQTGPALRNDQNVMQAQLSLIEDETMKEIYRLLSENIHRLDNNKK